MLFRYHFYCYMYRESSDNMNQIKAPPLWTTTLAAPPLAVDPHGLIFQTLADWIIANLQPLGTYSVQHTDCTLHICEYVSNDAESDLFPFSDLVFLKFCLFLILLWSCIHSFFSSPPFLSSLRWSLACLCLLRPVQFTVAWMHSRACESVWVWECVCSDGKAFVCKWFNVVTLTLCLNCW